MDAADRDLLATSVAAVIDGAAPAAVNDAALDGLGWSDMLAAEPMDAVSVVFGQLGRTAARTALLDDVVGAALGLPPGCAIVHPVWGDTEPGERGGHDQLRIDGTAGPRVTSTEVLHVLLRDGVAVLDADSAHVTATTSDDDHSRVVLDGPVVEWVPHASAAAEIAVHAARRALAHQLNGLAAGMLALARQHAVDRIQFGRPIGSFQAVRHKLAETHVAVEAAGDALAVADEGPAAVDLARVIAGRAALDAGRHCQQVLAGIGFTRDHDFHRHLFRALELDGLYGTTAGLTKQLGRRLLAEREIPRTVEL